jgi:hypothetical protein
LYVGFVVEHPPFVTPVTYAFNVTSVCPTVTVVTCG